MSEHYLRIIPTDPNYVPNSTARQQMLVVLGGMLRDGMTVDVQMNDTIEFVDQGEHFHSVSCPQCEKDLDLDWWQSAMDAAYDRNFSNLMTDTPCCRQRVSLNDLVYDKPAGFSRLVIEIDVTRAPDFMLSEGQLYDLSQILREDLKQIQAMY